MKLDTRHSLSFAKNAGTMVPQDNDAVGYMYEHPMQASSAPLWLGNQSLVPVFDKDNLPVSTPKDEVQRRQIAKGYTGMDMDIKSASAREIALVSLELYVAGMLRWEEYAELAFQPELHPDYNATIGALLEEPANPDKPQDFVRVWEERLSYDLRYNKEDQKRIKMTTRIAGVFRQLAGIPAFGL